MKAKTTKFIGFILFVIYIIFYANITLFYHSHTLHGIKIYHSHVHIQHHDAQGVPIEHSHSDDEFVVIQLINHVIVTLIIGYFFMILILLLLNQYQLPIVDSYFSPLIQKGFYLRDPPAICI